MVRISDMGIELVTSEEVQGTINAISIRPTLFDRIMMKQLEDPYLVELMLRAREGSTTDSV